MSDWSVGWPRLNVCALLSAAKIIKPQRRESKYPWQNRKSHSHPTTPFYSHRLLGEPRRRWRNCHVKTTVNYTFIFMREREKKNHRSKYFWTLRKKAVSGCKVCLLPLHNAITRRAALTSLIGRNKYSCRIQNLKHQRCYYQRFSLRQ